MKSSQLVIKIVLNETTLNPLTEKPLMRFLSLIRLCLAFFSFVSFYSCNEKEEFNSEALEDYLPLNEDKYIIYRVDSTIFTNFGAVTEIHSYQEKHVIDTVITDNLGRTSYRVFVYQRDSAGTQTWQPRNSSTYYITPLPDQIELVDENNFRFIKMHLPLRDGYSWKGNKYLPTTQGGPYASKFSFSNDDNMPDWDYYYDGLPSSFSYQNMNYTDVYTVEEADEAYNVPITDPNAYAAKSRALEKYSKNIGLIFRQFEMWEYQPNPGGIPYKTGFGVTMWMIDHN